MKKFYFRLETPLRIKQLKEKMEKQKLSQALYQKRSEENKLAEMELTKDNIREELDNRLIGSVEIRDLSDFSVFASKMIKLIEAQKKIVEHVSELCEESKRDFMKSRIERQIYEKIKEYHYMEYNKMVYREEQKISDELANINHGRLERNLANEQY